MNTGELLEPTDDMIDAEFIETIKEQLDDLKINFINRHAKIWSDKAINESTNQTLIYWGYAVRHWILCNLDSQFIDKNNRNKLGYLIADSETIDLSQLTHEDLKIYRNLHMHLSLSDYVYTHTHYDMCSNGHYYRMS